VNVTLLFGRRATAEDSTPKTRRAPRMRPGGHPAGHTDQHRRRRREDGRRCLWPRATRRVQGGAHTRHRGPWPLGSQVRGVG